MNITKLLFFSCFANAKALDLSGKAGDTYMVNAWGCGTALPETDNDTARRFGVEVVFFGTDGTEEVHYTNFSPDMTG